MRCVKDSRRRHEQQPGHVVHGYDRIDLEIVWNVVTAELPPLVRHLERMVQEPPGRAAGAAAGEILLPHGRCANALCAAFVPCASC
jgi:hypothetical protein